jgi:hypothetical protein
MKAMLRRKLIAPSVPPHQKKKKKKRKKRNWKEYTLVAHLKALEQK